MLTDKCELGDYYAVMLFLRLHSGESQDHSEVEIGYLFYGFSRERVLKGCLIGDLRNRYQDLLKELPYYHNEFTQFFRTLWDTASKVEVADGSVSSPFADSYNISRFIDNYE